MYSIHCTGRICLPRAVKAALASLVAVVYLTGPSCADTLRNPAACGIRPWERSLRDVNLVNGNLFKSFTDIQVAPARGAGLVLQRTYNSNDAREGPFGVGWTHAYDIRTEDTGADTMARTDFFGGKHSYVREADGLYKPPPYKRSIAATVATDTLDDSVTADEEEDKDGTVKHFERIGNYRVCNWIEDRHGNRTNLTYSTTGLLESVEDPSHRSLTFTWTDLGSGGQHHYRVTSVQASYSSQAFQTVDYDYFEDGETDTNDSNRYSLRSVTLYPGGGAPSRTTDYTYTSHAREGITERHLLASIVDPLGHYVLYSYGDVGCVGEGYPHAGPYAGVWVEQVDEPGSVDERHKDENENPVFRHVWRFLGADSHFYCTYKACESNDGLLLFTAVDGNCPQWEIPHIDLISNGPGFAPGTSDTFCYTYLHNADMSVAQATRAAGAPWEYPGLFGQQNTQYNTSGNPTQSHQTGFANMQTGAGVTTRSYFGAEYYFQPEWSVDGRGVRTDYEYFPRSDPSPGNRGNLESVTVDPEGLNLKTSFTYNQYGQKVTEEDSCGVVTEFTYGDAWGNLTAVVQDAGTGRLNRTTEMIYDASGRATSFTDPAGQEITTTYNNIGQPLSVAYPATQNTLAETMTYSYEENGRVGSVIAATTAATRVVQFSYETCDDDDDPNTPDVSLNDRVVNVTETVNSVIVSSVSYEYGLAGEVVKKYLPNGQVLQYDYGFDPENPESAIPSVMPRDEPDSLMPRLRSIEDQDGRRVEYVFDGLGTLVEARTNMQYEGEGANRHLARYLLAQYTPETSVVDSNTYTRGLTQSVVNTWNEFDEQTQQWRDAVQLTANAYTYDSGGNRLTNAITYPDETSRTEAYGYDGLSRLISVDYDSDATIDARWAYDAVGNRLSDRLDLAQNAWYNAANMLLSYAGQSYTNDLNGNTLTGGGRTNVWDSQNRLVQTTFGGTTTGFTYGPDGLRRTATSGGVTTQYILDGQNVAQEVSPSGVVRYLWGPRGPEARIDPSGNPLWFLYDGHGNVLGEVNNDGVINPDGGGDPTEIRDFDPWGYVLNAQYVADNGNRLKYCGALGHPSETATGLIYMRARHYDPVLGRFMSEDPAKDGKNWFLYADGNPVAYWDANGRDFSVAGVTVTTGMVANLSATSQAFIGGLTTWAKTTANPETPNGNAIEVLQAAVGGAIAGYLAPSGAGLAAAGAFLGQVAANTTRIGQGSTWFKAFTALAVTGIIGAWSTDPDEMDDMARLSLSVLSFDVGAIADWF